MLADHLFEHSMQRLRVLGGVPGNRDGRIKLENVAIFFLRPNRKTGNHRRAGAGGDFRERHVGAGRSAEEVDEDSFIESGVLVHQNSDGAIGGEAAQNRPGGVPFADDLIAGELAACLDDLIDAWVVEWPDHNIHGLSKQRVRKGAQLPVAEVRGRKQNTASLFFRFLKMLQPVIADPLAYVAGVNSGQAREGPQHSRQRRENLIDNRFTFSRGRLRIRQFQVAARDAAQTRIELIQYCKIEPRQPKRTVREGPEDEADEKAYSIQPPPSTRSES